MAITFLSEGISFTLKQKTLHRSWLKQVIATEKQQAGEISYVFVDDEYLLKINQQFLKHNFYTDIITFDYSEPVNKVIAGDLMISIDRVKDNAKQLGVAFEEELRRVMVHGVLHLCGYKDKKPADVKKIRSREGYHLKRFVQ